MTTPRIKTITAAEEEAVINVVVLAFSGDPRCPLTVPRAASVYRKFLKLR